MAATIKILMILTSQPTMGVGGAPTGVWFEELTAPYYAFIDAGAEVEVVSVAGGRIPIDPHSLKATGNNPASVERFLKDPPRQNSCRPDRIDEQGAMMEERIGSIRTGIQG
jgi:putative intracellular protease/amidase